jgi:hypothetical protein
MEIKEMIEVYNDLRKIIAEAIDYGEPRYLGEINTNEIDSKWSIDEDIFRIHEDDDDYYEYIVSSYGNKGEKFFKGEKDGYTFIMARTDEEFAENANVFIVKNENKVEDE